MSTLLLSKLTARSDTNCSIAVAIDVNNLAYGHWAIAFNSYMQLLLLMINIYILSMTLTKYTMAEVSQTMVSIKKSKMTAYELIIILIIYLDNLQNLIFVVIFVGVRASELVFS